MLKKRRLIITGGTQGLGREISRSFASKGFEVTAIFKANVQSAEVLQDEFRKEKWTGDFVRHDIATGPFRLVETDAFDDLVVIHNACAPFFPKPLHLLDWRDYDQSWSVAVRGAYNLLQPCLREMLRARRATFVAILSAVIERNEPPPKGFSAYAVAKLGLKGFALSVRSEYGSRGIRCFNVYPRFMNTSLTNGWNGRMKPDQVTSFPLSPETVAAKVLERVLSENTHPGDQEIVF